MTTPTKGDREKAREILIQIRKLPDKDPIVHPLRQTKRTLEIISTALAEVRSEQKEIDAGIADKLFNGIHSPYEYSKDVAAAIRKGKT